MPHLPAPRLTGSQDRHSADDGLGVPQAQNPVRERCGMEGRVESAEKVPGQSGVIVLPWPDKKLSPNARCHWAQKAKAVKAARLAAGWATRAAKVRVVGEGAIGVRITFYPPSKRRYDLDNLLASMKSALDGVADGFGVDDSRFRISMALGEPVKGGRVEIKAGNERGEAMKIALIWVDALLCRWGRWAIRCESRALGFSSACSLGGVPGDGDGYDSAIPRGVILDDDMEAVDGAVRRLPKVHRLAVIEVYQHGHGKSDRALAAALGIHVDTMSRYVCEAHRKIALDISAPFAQNSLQSVNGGIAPARIQPVTPARA